MNRRILNGPIYSQSFPFSKAGPKDPGSKDPKDAKPAKSVEELKDAVTKAGNLDELKKAVGKPEDIEALKKAGAKPEDIEKLLKAGEPLPPKPPKIEIRIVPALYPRSGYDERNMKMGRRLSPHLTIYKRQLTSILSILLRITGCVLAVGVWSMGLNGLLCDMTIDDMVKAVEKSDTKKKILSLLKVGVALPFAYHIVGGTRHLLWYLNIFLSKQMVYVTGYTSIVLTLILAGVLSCVKPEELKKKVENVEYIGQSEIKVQNLVMGENHGIIQTKNLFKLDFGDME